MQKACHRREFLLLHAGGKPPLLFERERGMEVFLFIRGEERGAGQGEQVTGERFLWCRQAGGFSCLLAMPRPMPCL